MWPKYINYWIINLRINDYQDFHLFLIQFIYCIELQSQNEICKNLYSSKK